MALSRRAFLTTGVVAALALAAAGAVYRFTRPGPQRFILDGEARAALDAIVPAMLSVHDGSLFPTSVGANPQLSIYAVAARLASGLAAALGGKAAV